MWQCSGEGVNADSMPAPWRTIRCLKGIVAHWRDWKDNHGLDTMKEMKGRRWQAWGLFLSLPF